MAKAEKKLDTKTQAVLQRAEELAEGKPVEIIEARKSLCTSSELGTINFVKLNK